MINTFVYLMSMNPRYLRAIRLKAQGGEEGNGGFVVHLHHSVRVLVEFHEFFG